MELSSWEIQAQTWRRGLVTQGWLVVQAQDKAETEASVTKGGGRWAGGGSRTTAKNRRQP
jgi:hypothetical protein